MTIETTPLFRDDAYLRTAEAQILSIDETGRIALDRSIFYPMGGGQPGDTGFLERADGQKIAITTTLYGASKSDILLVPEENGDSDHGLHIGEQITSHIDWATRYAHMRMHSALHLLSVALPFPVTGGSIGADASRLDFDIPEANLDKQQITDAVNAEIANDHAITTEWITDGQLAANPGLIKTMSVKPPMGSGKVRLVRIGDIDLQPCGGTHVTLTSEIGPIEVTKIEKKGKQNRRVRIKLVEP